MKFQQHKQFSAFLLGVALSVSIIFPFNIAAAPGTISDLPLFLTNKAQPNIFFLVDDSGSMDFEMMTDEVGLYDDTYGGAFINGGPGAMTVQATGGGYRGYFYVTNAADHVFTPFNAHNGSMIPTQQSVDALGFTNYLTGIWRARNHVYNRMYYNPSETYSPWVGVDNAGNAFQEAYITGTGVFNTRLDPYLIASAVIDLTANQTVATKRPEVAAEGTGTVDFNVTYMPARYWFWQDGNADKIVDATETKTLVEIKSTNTMCTGGLKATTAVQATGCMLRSYADEMQNFANWFTYYRRREYAAKNALSAVVKNSNSVRMSMATINPSAAKRIEMANMNADITTGNKKALTDKIFSIDSTGGTGLIAALYQAGNYYDGGGSTAFGNNKLALDTSVPTGATGAPEECSQNFTVLMTDGYYTGSMSGLGDRDSDSSTWTGDYDPENDGTTISNTFSFDGIPYEDDTASANGVTWDNTNTLADISMYFYENDLRTSTLNKVPIRCGVDENPGQHMVTYTVAFGVTGSIDNSTLPAHPIRGYATNCTANTGSAFTWTNPSTSAGKIDELIHAAYNGRGEYLNAGDPTELSTSLTDTFRGITSRIGAGAGVTFNTNSLNSNSKLYQASFNSTQWSGELEAYSLNAFAEVAASPDWQASSVLDARVLSTNDRTIISYNDTSNAAIAFDWANLSSSQKDDLRTDSTGALEVTSGYPKANAILEYIRGDRNCEIGASGTCSLAKEFRARNSRLGDFVHSQPLYSGAVKQLWPEQAPFGVSPENYSAFKSGDAAASNAFSSTKNATNRTPMIYTGANDGMLHAFNANTGDEVFAYIPSMLYSTTAGKGLHALSEPAYSHKYYVDLSPSLSQAFIDTGSGDNWHSVLIGGLRGGGRGIFSLNVTDPDSVIEASGATAKETAAKNMLMWEFTNADDANLGYSFSRPVVVPLGISTGVEWYVVVGNGYNSDTTAGADGKAYLFVLKLEGPGADNVWNEGTDYYKVPTGAGSTSDLNGLSTPAVLDLTGDSIADRVYAGDLQGNLWAFDLEGNPSGTNGWSSVYTASGSPAPLFYATDGDAGAGNKQPITTKPSIIRHPTVDTVSSGGGDNEPNLMIYFGTGQYLTSSDLSTTSKQSFYAVWDKGDSKRTVHRTDSADTSNHLVNKVFTNPDALSRVGGTEAVDYSVSTVYGWYYDLPETSERSTTNSTIRGDIIFFNTLIPSLEPCGYGGSGWELGVQSKDGSSECGTFDTNGDGIVDCATDSSSAGIKKVGSVPNESSFISGGGGGAAPVIPGNDDFNNPNENTPAGTLITGGGGSCPDQYMPAIITCPSTQKAVFKTATDVSGCKTYSWACQAICTPPKKPVTKITNNSDGTLTSTITCVDEKTSHTGRFSWRELPF